MNNIIICDTPETINAYHMLSIRSALKLESLGMRHSRGSVAKVARGVLKEAGKKSPANKVALLAEFNAHLQALGILRV